MSKFISKKYSIHYILFINGAVILALEILGVRILAPFVGTTITVWSAVIGVILFASSFGYYIGGYIADKKISRKILATISFEAGFFILLILPLKDSVHVLVNSSNYGLSGLIAAIYLLALPTFFLSMTTTYAIRLATKNIDSVASVSGLLYGIGTIGSILGIILVSFFLIPNYGNTTIVIILSLASLVNSVISLRSA